jgi:hypothetical protein
MQTNLIKVLIVQLSYAGPDDCGIHVRGWYHFNSGELSLFIVVFLTALQIVIDRHVQVFGKLLIYNSSSSMRVSKPGLQLCLL